MARRMSRFIHLAIGRGQGGRPRLGHRLRGDVAGPARPGRASSSTPAAAGSRQIIDGTHIHDSKGPRFVIAVRRAGPVGLDGRLHAVDGVRPDRAGHDPGRRLRDVGHRLPRRAPAHPTGECDVVLAGGSEAPIVPMGVAALANMGALSKRNDSPETASRPFDATRDGFVLGEGAGRRRRRVARARAGSRRDAHRRDPRWRPDRRRVPHQRAGADRPRPDPRDDLGAAQRRGRAGRGRLHRRPRHLDAAQRRDRDAGDQGGLRRPRLQGRDQLAEVDDRPPRRGGRHRQRARGDRGDPRPGHPADREPAHARPGVRPRLRAADRAQGARSRRSRSTASGSAARTRWRSSGASRTPAASRAALEGLDGGDVLVRQRRPMHAAA